VRPGALLVLAAGLIAAALSMIGGASTAFADGGTATISGTYQ